MEQVYRQIRAGKSNFIFLGEAGSGKSEIALNFARMLSEIGDKPVHFFDMDMTKPLFRSRDLCENFERNGIEFHYEEQFMDAPTLVGGTRRLLMDPDCYVVMDVGGDHIGARSIGGIMIGTDRTKSMIYYVLNAYRPWSDNMEHIDGTLGKILAAAHIPVSDLHLVSNPNFGTLTKKEDVIEGCRRMEALVSPYRPIDFVCVSEKLHPEVKHEIAGDILVLKRYLQYPWEDDRQAYRMLPQEPDSMFLQL